MRSSLATAARMQLDHLPGVLVTGLVCIWPQGHDAALERVEVSHLALAGAADGGSRLVAIAEQVVRAIGGAHSLRPSRLACRRYAMVGGDGGSSG